MPLFTGSSVSMVSAGPRVSLVVESVTVVVLPAASVKDACRLTVPCARPEASTGAVANCPAAGVPQVAEAMMEPICTVTARPSSEQVPAMT